MKIFIPSEGTKLESKFNERFARASHFVIYDTETEDFEAETNEFANSDSGVGVQVVQYAVNKGIDLAVAHHFGPKALDALKSFNVRTYVVDGDISSLTVKDIVNNVQNNTLKEV